MSFYLIISTVSNKEEGEKIANLLLDSKLAACINVIEGVTSYYIWKGERVRESELVLLIKTREDKLKEIMEKIKENHSYTVPEIIATKIQDGNKDYLSWIEEVL